MEVFDKNSEKCEEPSKLSRRVMSLDRDSLSLYPVETMVPTSDAIGRTMGASSSLEHSPSAMISNSVSNLIVGFNSSTNGDFNHVFGDNIEVEGDYNEVKGKNIKIKGSYNKIYGENIVAEGEYLTIMSLRS